MESRAELLAARVSLMEQLLLAQHDREVNLYRDTIRMVTIFGGAFAGLCMIGLLAAAFLNYRALMAVQNMYGRIQTATATTAANGLLPAPASATVPGIERVQASGQRFQSRMTGLEQRLAELEHLAGRESAGGHGSEANALAADAGEDPSLTMPARPAVPRAMILVHKAQTQANLGKLSEALETLEEAAHLEGANTEVHLARGQVLEKLGRLGDALKAYDSAVDADGQNTSALLLKAGVLNRQERFSEALACYERALEVHRAAV
jgi:tetratricopeptide (TPR) repeat protein